MNLYARADERAIRVQREIIDWERSGLVTPEQRDRLLADVVVDLRRTNRFIRVTLAILGFVIINSFTGFIVLILGAAGEQTLRWLVLAASIGCAALATTLITRYRFYRFGIEEAAAVAAALFFAFFVAQIDDTFSTMRGFGAAAVAAALVFMRFGYLYAGVAAVLLVPMVIFDFELVDTVGRLMASAVLLTVFFIARERREDHDPDFPADSYGVIEAVAWGALYFMANLKVSPWFSVPDDVPVFYWGTYVVIWLLPVAGLWMAVRDRQRALLDVNIVLAIVTLMSTKPYLGAEQQPWDPILFGLLLIAVAIGVRRWLASGPGGSRRGVVAERVLASEAERMALIGSATVLAPGAPPARTHEDTFGGGASGGGGASATF